MLAGLGAAQYAVRSYEDAARSLCKASDLKPGEAAPYLFLGQMEKTVNGPLPCAEEKLAQFAEQQPANAAANYYYAISLVKREKMRTPRRPLGGTNAARKIHSSRSKYGAAYIELGALAVQAAILSRRSRIISKRSQSILISVKRIID